jgi:hypothetical protein
MGVPSVADLRALRPSGAAVAGATALLVAAAGGWWLGGATRDAAPVPNAVATVGALRLEVEPAWVRAGAAPGLPVRDAAVMAPAPGLDERAVLVTGPPSDASLIPRALRAELPASLPVPRRATLAKLPAWRYGPLRDDGRLVVVTIVPTTAGVLALACSRPTTSWSGWRDCENGVHAVSAGDAKTLAPSADLAFRQAAGPVLETLDEARVAGRARLRGARRAAAASLANEHREAATALAAFATAGAPAAAVGALRDAARGYDALAAAPDRRFVTRGQRVRFVAARQQVARADAALAAALAELRR